MDEWLAWRSDSFTSGKSVPDTSGWVAVVYISTQRRTERPPAVVGIDIPCLVTTPTMSVFLEQWDIHWWDFTVDWMGHVLNKNKFPLTIPFDKRVILKLLTKRVLILLHCKYEFQWNKMAVSAPDTKFGNQWIKVCGSLPISCMYNIFTRTRIPHHR
jgi:hypothetical protein